MLSGRIGRHDSQTSAILMAKDQTGTAEKMAAALLEVATNSVMAQRLCDA